MMKRKFLCLLLALCMMLGLAATVSALTFIDEPIYEDEPNDTLWNAQPIEFDEVYTGQAMAYCNDSDLYTFTLEESTEIRISMHATNICVDLALFDSEGRLLTNAEHVGLNDGFEFFNILPMELPAGTYYVGIWTTDGTNHGYYFNVLEGAFPCWGDHMFYARKPIIPATCQSEGLMLCTCLCGATTTETAPADPDAHTFETEIATPYTCTENGLAVHTCTDCGYVEEEILLAQHTAPSILVIYEPTADKYGCYNIICADCGGVEPEGPIYPLNHMFIDVKPDEYYELPVCWTLYKGITAGTSPYHFSPNGQCQRAQIVTFLWRAAGCPKVEGENPFTDVKETAFYYDAVLWAVKEGITTGTSADTFSPFKTCSRAEVVTFLWRANGKPDANGANPFEDLKEDSFYEEAVLWAVENGITNGVDDTHFGPTAPCNRAQVVTFLYRAHN